MLGPNFAYNPRVGASDRGQVRIGCAGWNYKQWKAPVYDGAPQRLWLARYAELTAWIPAFAGMTNLKTVADVHR